MSNIECVYVEKCGNDVDYPRCHSCEEEANTAANASRDEMANLLDIVRIRLADARPFGGPDDAMLTAEIAATLKRAGTPTKKSDYVRAGDICVSVFAAIPMSGVVVKINDKTTIPQAVVKWESGSTGTHTITTLKRAGR